MNSTPALKITLNGMNVYFPSNFDSELVLNESCAHVLFCSCHLSERLFINNS